MSGGTMFLRTILLIRAAGDGGRYLWKEQNETNQPIFIRGM